MRIRPIIFLLSIAALPAGCGGPETNSDPAPAIATRQIEASDTFHNRELQNPYAWLENVQSPEVKAWVAEQDERTLSALAEAREETQGLQARLTAYASQPNINTPARRGDVFFFMIDSRAHKSPALYINAGGDDLLLASGEDFAAIGMQAAQINDFRISPDGRYAAIVGFEPASGRRAMRILDISARNYLPGAAEGARLGDRPWTDDSAAIFYAVRAGENTPAAVRRRGLDGDESNIVTAEKSENIRYSVNAAGPGYVIAERTPGEAYQAIWIDENNPALNVDLFSSKTFSSYLGWSGGAAYFLTTNGATGRNEIVRARRDEADTTRERILDITDFFLSGAYLYGGKLVFDSIVEGTPVIQIYDLDGAHLKSLTPPYGLVWTNFPVERTPIMGDAAGRYAYAGSISLEAPGVYELDLEALELRPWRLNGGGATDIVIKRDAYESFDGVSAPISLSHLSSTKLDGSAPALVWVYGAHGFTATPYFNAFFRTFIEAGGVLVMPQVRGGGVYGPAWHQAGSRANKKNTVGDTIAALEWLIEKSVTQPGRIAVLGNSAGSVPAAAAGLKRRDLVAAMILEVPLSDMARHNQWSGGWNSEFGDPAISEEFDAILEFSPYELALGAQQAPATLLFVGENDNTAPPPHGYKLAAALQRVESEGEPVLLRLVKGAGHQIGVNEAQRTENQALQLAFLHRQIGLQAD